MLRRILFGVVLSVLFFCGIGQVHALSSFILEFLVGFPTSGLGAKISSIWVYHDSHGVTLRVDGCAEAVVGLVEYFSNRPGVTMVGDLHASTPPFVSATWDEVGSFELVSSDFMLMAAPDPELPNSSQWSWTNPGGPGVVAKACNVQGQRAFAKEFALKPFSWLALIALLVAAAAGIVFKKKEAQPVF